MSRGPFQLVLVTATAASLAACSSIRVDPYLPTLNWQSAPVAPTAPVTETPAPAPAAEEPL